MQATCFGSLEPSSGLYLYLNTDPKFYYYWDPKSFTVLCPPEETPNKTVNITAECKYKQKKRVTEDTSVRTLNVQSKHNITKYEIIYLAF